MRILFLILLCISVAENKLVVKDAGISHITKGDIGMIFYIQVENIGNTSYTILVKMEKCCEEFSKNDMDCEMMQLIGGNMGIVYPRRTKHLTLIYPSMYLHNRYGQCLIVINYYTGKHLKVNIEFDTMLSTDKENPLLRGYPKTKLMCCKTTDLDPLENCSPVNCEIKYLGRRNFFNKYWDRCQKVPICISDSSKDLPDVAYIPMSNQCRDLEDIINADDIEYLQNGKIEEDYEDEATPYLFANVQCHHGTLNNETGFCICTKGWTTAPIEKDQYEPDLAIYHMCNMRVYSSMDSKFKLKQIFLMIGIIGAVIAVFMLFITIICNLLFNFIFNPKASSPTSTYFGTSLSDDLQFVQSKDVTTVQSSENNETTSTDESSTSTSSTTKSTKTHTCCCDIKNSSTEESSTRTPSSTTAPSSNMDSSFDQHLSRGVSVQSFLKSKQRCAVLQSQETKVKEIEGATQTGCKCCDTVYLIELSSSEAVAQFAHDSDDT